MMSQLTIMMFEIQEGLQHFVLALRPVLVSATLFFVVIDGHESGPYMLANRLALGKGAHDGLESGPYMLAHGLALGKGGGVGQSWKILAAIGSKQASYSQGRCRPQLSRRETNPKINQANVQTPLD